MTTPISPATLEKLVPAAADSVGAIDGCYRVLSKMDIPNSERNNVAVALLYASMDQARSASFLIAKDVEQSVFGALILLRSQLDQLMRAAFFAGPASADQLESYLADDELPRLNGNRLGPRSLSRINEEFFGWEPVGRVPALVEHSWGTLSGMTHGGRALLNYYISDDGVGPYPPTDEFIGVLSNTVALAHLGVAIALTLAGNFQSSELQAELQEWNQAGHVFFDRWGPTASEQGVAAAADASTQA